MIQSVAGIDFPFFQLPNCQIRAGALPDMQVKPASRLEAMVRIASDALLRVPFFLSSSVSNTRIDALDVAHPYRHSLSRSQQLADISRQVSLFANSAYLDDEEARENVIAASEHALVFMSRLPLSMPLPWVSHNGEGDVFLKWSEGEKEAEAMFDGTGEVGYALRHGDVFIGGAEEALPSKVPGDLAAYFQA
ncbi:MULTISPECIES: hypothetical protein [Achromobacter]|uniref:hypothetical protein n=1 Tax=Achromobacter TaxID=222 RepID=UPI000FDB6D37|nr:MULTISPECIES: hypothetical protein [Achromobacter]MCH1984854.1 hypothetical protein [Achromobacter xylosoxidans]MCH1994864.1 hypothetical protein [Achromobacter xylosoxidans]MCH4573847.1 hypothetical protein [Achromobacter xylosoxidans]MCH4586017.1 hypothetical protein [Achromobacter xylosoxidans]MCV6795812.1 hypothetical protein [Achromobacter ruhlandii]